MDEHIAHNFDEGLIAIDMEIRDARLVVTLKDGRIIGTPLD